MAAMVHEVSASPRGALVAVVLLGCVLRLTGLEIQSLWYDEAATLHVALADDPVGVLRGDRHPPLSYLLLRVWVDGVGESDLALRLLPALLSCVALAVFARGSARLVNGDVARVWAVALYALSPFLIWHGQEVRMYAFVELGAVVALTAGTAWLDEGRWRWGLAGVVLGVAFASGSHYLGALAAAVVVAAAVASPNAPGRRRVGVGAAALSGFAVWLPWILTVLPDQLRSSWGHQVRAGARDLAELPARLFLVEVAAVPAPWHLVFLAPAAIVLGAVILQAGRWLHGSAGPKERRALTMAIVPIVAALAPGLFGVLNFAPKYLIAAAPAMIATVAAGIVALPWRGMRILGFLVLVVSASGLLAVHRFANHREDYRSACAEIAAAWRPGDTVVAISGTPPEFSQAPLRHYLRGRPEILGAIVAASAAIADPAALVRDGARVHVVHRTAPYSDPQLVRLRDALHTEFAGEDRERIRYLRFVSPR